MGLSVKVTTSARLHLGFLDLNGGMGRRFGSLGLAIDRPLTSLTIERAPATRVDGPERERVAAHLAALRDHFGLKSCYGITIDTVIPAHVGLGSGTQLALAVAAALRRLEDLPPDSAGDALLSTARPKIRNWRSPIFHRRLRGRWRTWRRQSHAADSLPPAFS